MAGIWAEVLRLERVGINDNLFELGADSLHVFQIAARANKAGIRGNATANPAAIERSLRFSTIGQRLTKPDAVSEPRP